MNQPGGYKWAIKSPDQYAGGHYGIRSGGGAWVPWTDGDLLFRNWGLRGPQVAAGLSVDSASAGVGDPLAYTVFLNNTGTTPAPIVWANLTLSPNTTYDSDTAAAAGGMVLGPFSWGFAEVGIGPHSFKVAVHVNAQIFDGLPLDAKIAMDYTDQTGALQEHTEATTTVTARTPSLTISKSVDPTFVGSDENVNYTITIVNSGSRPSPYVWVNDTLPQEVSYRSNNASALANYSSGGFDGLVVHANFSNLPRGSFSFDILARTRPGLQNGTVFTNIATADYTDKRGIRTWPTVTASATARIHGASVVVENVASLATAEPGQD